MSTFPSKILEDAVREFSRLPGIGKRSALRLVLHLLKSPEEEAGRLGTALIRLRQDIRYCPVCHSITDKDLCEICSDPGRDESTLCVVEDIRDLLAVENTSQYRGRYHVLGGILSPMDGIGPGDLQLETLLERLKDGKVKEIIMALRATMEGDTTMFYIYRKMIQLNREDIRFTTIARGVSVGDELEYADEVTLGRSILNRVPYANSLSRKEN